MRFIRLKSGDGEIFKVDPEIAKCSGLIMGLIESLGIEDNEEEIVPLPNINSIILRKVLQWTKYHKNDPPFVEDEDWKEKRTDDICAWDSQFLQVDQGTLFELMAAADCLEIKGLMDVTCKTLANMIKSREPEELRRIFNIKNDFTAIEEAQVRIDNSWCEKK